ncbi:hypothetical protein RJ641_017282 [Dillenia turbinata]|uniref:Uncharacterized protein n=1 Tax=Dillenia turbinata TaxID=194707 RepID=A0AAN8UNQ9_9MAGN
MGVACFASLALSDLLVSVSKKKPSSKRECFLNVKMFWFVTSVTHLFQIQFEEPTSQFHHAKFNIGTLRV